MKLRLTSMTAALAVGITLAVGIASASAAYFYSVHHFDTLVGAARNAAAAQAALMQAALEHGMLENDRTLITRMVEGFGRHPGVAAVIVLDRSGQARISSGPLAQFTPLTLDSPTCQACHRFPPALRGGSRVLEVSGGTRLRTVVPFRNREACHACHDPRHAINGILLMDVDVGDLRATMNRDLRWMVAGSGAATLVLVGAIAMLLRVGVVRRLQRFETTARLIAGGDLERRVPADGSDTIAWLAREFNTMADAMAGLVGQVRRQHERLETIINSVDDGIVVLDPRRRILAANTAFLRRTGHVRDEALGCCCRDLGMAMCHPADCPTLACLTAGERQVRLFEGVAADGTPTCEEIHASPVPGPAGELACVVEVWRDISDRRAAEARMAESHRLASLGVLASGFSHELNTPLATVLMCVEGILRDLKDGEAAPARQSAAVAREQILRCRSITQHFLRLSRGQSSSGGVVDLGAMVATVVGLVTPTARSLEVGIVVGEMAHSLQAHADDTDLQQALLNLLLNAVQVSPRGAVVHVDAWQDERVHVRVSDSGPGVAPQDRARIFEPFVSLRRGGTGLGLFIALDFVRRWGGEIVVGSRSEGGATFDIVLPRPAVEPSTGLDLPQGMAIRETQAHAPAR